MRLEAGSAKGALRAEDGAIHYPILTPTAMPISLLGMP